MESNESRRVSSPERGELNAYGLPTVPERVCTGGRIAPTEAAEVVADVVAEDVLFSGEIPEIILSRIRSNGDGSRDGFSSLELVAWVELAAVEEADEAGPSRFMEIEIAAVFVAEEEYGVVAVPAMKACIIGREMNEKRFSSVSISDRFVFSFSSSSDFANTEGGSSKVTESRKNTAMNVLYVIVMRIPLREHDVL